MSGRGREKLPPDPSNNQANWFEEFKKLNSTPAPAPPSTSAQPAGKATERRKHFRFEIEDVQASLTREGVLSVFGVGRGNRARAALDLSEGGVRFLITERIPVGTKVRVVIEMEKYKDQIEAVGEVKWCYQSAKKPEDFYAGVQFIGLDPVQARKISLMREWFTSSQFKAVRETTKKQQRRGNDFIFPK